MASTFGGSVNEPLFSSDKPWVWAMIPVGFVVVIGAVALCLHSRRRVKHFDAGLVQTSALGGARLDPAGTRALERDLEEAWTRGATPTRRPPARYQGRTGSGVPSAAAGRWTRPTSRWQWAGVARQEEGLNELGEAPPPYEKPQEQSDENGEGARKSSSIDGNIPRISDSTTTTSFNNMREESVELQNLSPPPPSSIAHRLSMPTVIEMGESARVRENTSSAPGDLLPPPAYDSDGVRSPAPIIARPRRDGSPPPPVFIGGHDDGSAVVSVTPVPPAVLPPPDHHSV
ncbi:hypothetical protein V8F33_002031 [Rhypophila sp. PSN 637]